MKKSNLLCRSSRWIGNNLVLVTLLVAGVISFWPEGNNIYMIKSVPTEDAYFSTNQVAFDMEESMEMGATPMMARGGMAKMMMPEQAFAEDFSPEETDRKIIRNASLQVEVKNTETSRTEIEKLTKSLKGHITNLNSYEVRTHVLSYNFTVRIPAENLNDALTKFTSLGIKKSESMSEQDITSQYADTANRLKNLESRRERLRELMERETDNLADVLSIDRELSSVQQQIESYERTLKRHDTNVAFSTITLNIQPEPEIGDFSTPEWTPNRSWKQAVNDLIISLQDILDRAIQILVFAPIWLPILLLIWVIQRFIRRRQKCLFQIKK